MITYLDCGLYGMCLHRWKRKKRAAVRTHVYYPIIIIFIFCIDGLDYLHLLLEKLFAVNITPDKPFRIPDAINEYRCSNRHMQKKKKER